MGKNQELTQNGDTINIMIFMEKIIMNRILLSFRMVLIIMMEIIIIAMKNNLRVLGIIAVVKV
jgi:hypothetical protein